VGVAQLDRKREMLHLKFTETAAVDPNRLMRLVAKAQRRGAQFTPQGILKYPLTSTEPSAMMAEARTLLDNIQLEPVAV